MHTPYQIGVLHFSLERAEGIIAGIVAREYNELGQLIDEIKDATKQSDAIPAIVDHAVRSTSRYIDHSHASLAMEILAESARNPEVASLIQQSDEEVFQSFHNLLGGGTPEVKSRCEILAALLEGFSMLEQVIAGEVEGIEVGELEALGVEVAAPEGAASKSNRRKYSCPKCEINAWGKPGLSLICGECQEPLADVGA
ncbi:hypothetical protein [Zoogloea oleivorans]|uniref:hypothetical protein n=1 Tax=Zoogloea oleivorans TaxID=1552750 RepID=UPI00165245DE|nr:hypothetical protein [Zoogloea oleivorans]